MMEKNSYSEDYKVRLSKVGTYPMKGVNLKCFECSGYSWPEVKRCNNQDCALWVLKNNRNKRKLDKVVVKED